MELAEQTRAKNTEVKKEVFDMPVMRERGYVLPRSGQQFRRMREKEHMRRFIAEKTLTLDDICHPIFVAENLGRETPVENMPGLFYHSVDEAIEEIKEASDLGINNYVLRPRPDKSTVDNLDKSIAFEASAIEKISRHCPNVTKLIDGYFGMARTTGYYGAVDENGNIDHKETLREIAAHAVAQGNAGADIVIGIGRVDNTVSTMRQALDTEGLQNVSILSYSINFASSLAHAMLDGTDMSKSALKQTLESKVAITNMEEALRQTAAEIEEGADIIGIKPATVFMDAIARVKSQFRRPVATYIVSKEYVMVKAAAERGWIDERATVMEYMLSMKRAGADRIFSYWAKEVATWLKN